MDLAAALFLSHLVGDFPLQTNQIYRLKSEGWRGIALHALIHVIVAVLLVKRPLAVWPMLGLLGILHFLIDLIKLHLPTRRQTISFLLDQLAHILVIVGLVAVWSSATDSILPLSMLMPMIAYGLFLATLIFLWTLANDLSTGALGKRRDVQWAREHLLQLSQYAGLPFIFVLATQWYQNTSRTP